MAEQESDPITEFSDDEIRSDNQVGTRKVGATEPEAKKRRLETAPQYLPNFKYATLLCTATAHEVLLTT